MIRPLALSIAAGMALLTATLSGVAESFPVVHNEPITVRILGGKNGQPFAHLHLVLIAGYDQNDLHDQLYRAESLTDAHGQIRLPGQLANMPWLQVWVTRKSLCQTKPRGASYSVELIRRDGLSAPNHCGTATVVDAPGVFTVFVRGKGKNAVADISVAKAVMPAPEAARTALSVAEASLPATQPPPVAVALLAAPAPAPADNVLKPAETVRPVAAAPVVVTAPAPAHVAATNLAISPANAAVHHPIRRVAERPVSHRARPVLASCPVRQPAASVKSEDSSATAIKAIHKPKPVAGVRVPATASDKPTAPPNQK